MERLVEKGRTMNVDALAISLLHDSAIISRVRAWVPVSIPLFTNIKRGILSRGILGCNSSNTFLKMKRKFLKKDGLDLWSGLTLIPALELRTVQHPPPSTASRQEALGLSPRFPQETHDPSSTSRFSSPY